MQKHLLLLLSSLILAACGSTSSPSEERLMIPPMSGTWQEFGNTHQGNILVSYDTSSIRRNGDFALMRDRKIVIKPELEQYHNTPRYKIAVSDWEFNCKNYSYRLAASQFLDESGKIIQALRYTPVMIRPMPIAKNTIADKQYQLVCR